MTVRPPKPRLVTMGRAASCRRRYCVSDAVGLFDIAALLKMWRVNRAEYVLSLFTTVGVVWLDLLWFYGLSSSLPSASCHHFCKSFSIRSAISTTTERGSAR